MKEMDKGNNMVCIFSYIYHKYQSNVGQYTIRWSNGKGNNINKPACFEISPKSRASRRSNAPCVPRWTPFQVWRVWNAMAMGKNPRCSMGPEYLPSHFPFNVAFSSHTSNLGKQSIHVASGNRYGELTSWIVMAPCSNSMAIAVRNHGKAVCIDKKHVIISLEPNWPVLIKLKS